jgi:hypothetical protein
MPPCQLLENRFSRDRFKPRYSLFALGVGQKELSKRPPAETGCAQPKPGLAI